MPTGNKSSGSSKFVDHCVVDFVSTIKAGVPRLNLHKDGVAVVGFAREVLALVREDGGRGESESVLATTLCFGLGAGIILALFIEVLVSHELILTARVLGLVRRIELFI
jgi:hypothetical protein